LSELANEAPDPQRYRCIRCKAPADVIHKLLPFCFPHEPAESKSARLPQEGEMDQSTKTVSVDEPVIGAVAGAPVDASDTKGTAIGGGWVVNAKDGSELNNGFASKKEASSWASLEVEHKRLKAGQYKIARIK